MEKIFRQIKNRQSWDKSVLQEGMNPGDVPGDILNSFNTDKSTLSIYVFDEEHQDRLIAAYCTNRESISTLDFIVIDKKDFDVLGLSIIENSGVVCDDVVKSWHRDVVCLSTDKLLALANFSYNSATVVRVLDKKVGIAMNRMIEAGFIDEKKLNSNLAADLKKPKYKAV